MTRIVPDGLAAPPPSPQHALSLIETLANYPNNPNSPHSPSCPDKPSDYTDKLSSWGDSRPKHILSTLIDNPNNNLSDDKSLSPSELNKPSNPSVDKDNKPCFSVETAYDIPKPDYGGIFTFPTIIPAKTSEGSENIYGGIGEVRVVRLGDAAHRLEPILAMGIYTPLTAI